MQYRLHRRLIATILVSTLIAVAIMPGRALAGGNIGARVMLVEYYNRINARNYLAAYQQWEAPEQTYAEFVAGYGDTTYITAYFGGFQNRQPYSLEGCIAGVLIGYHTDGSATAYQGSYDVLYHPHLTGLAQWTIIEGTFTPLDHVPVDAALIYRDYLDVGCVEHGSGIEPPPQFMLMDYIDAVNRAEFDAAYARWSNPFQTYAEFVTGWGDTTETILFYGHDQQPTTGYFFAEVGRIPVVMLGYHMDGSRVAYQGCLGISYNAAAPPDGSRWGLYAAYLYPMPVEPTSPATIGTALNVACY